MEKILFCVRNAAALHVSVPEFFKLMVFPCIQFALIYEPMYLQTVKVHYGLLNNSNEYKLCNFADVYLAELYILRLNWVFIHYYHQSKERNRRTIFLSFLNHLFFAKGFLSLKIIYTMDA